MPKADFPPLFSSGLHKITLSALAHITRDNIPTQRRKDLLTGFAAFLSFAISANLVGMDIWIDGSFLTTKDEPDDVDCVLWVPESHIDQCADADYEKLQYLLNRQAIRYKYRVDLYIGNPAVAEERRYWERMLSTGHDSTSTKGFVSLTI